MVIKCLPLFWRRAWFFLIGCWYSLRQPRLRTNRRLEGRMTLSDYISQNALAGRLEGRGCCRFCCGSCGKEKCLLGRAQQEWLVDLCEECSGGGWRWKEPAAQPDRSLAWERRHPEGTSRDRGKHRLRCRWAVGRPKAALRGAPPPPGPAGRGLCSMSSSRVVRRTAAETELAAHLLLAAVTLGCLWGATEAQVREGGWLVRWTEKRGASFFLEAG